MAQQRILLNAKVPMNVVCLRPLVSWLRRDHSMALWLTSHRRGPHGRRPKSVIDAVPNNVAFHGVTAIHSPIASRMQFDLYLSPDMQLAGTRKARNKVHMFHGVSFKGASISPKALQHDHLFLFGEYHRRRFVEKGIVKEGDARLHMVGFPKIDALVDGTYDPRLTRLALGIPEEEGKKVVLYAPTWRGTSLDQFGEQIVEALSAMEVHLLIKLHDHSLNPKLAGRDWQPMIDRWKQKPNVTVVTDPDACPAMAASDVLVSDFSSAANEYLVLDRPIVYFQTDDLRANYSDKQIDQDMLTRRPGHSVNAAAALPESVNAALANPAEHPEVRQALARELFHFPGSATLRAIDEIYKITGLEVPLATRFAIQAAHRQADEQNKLIDRGRYPGQKPMVDPPA